MNFSSNQIGFKQATVYDISAEDLTGANSGQRPDLLAKTQAIFRTPDGKTYTANKARSQLTAAPLEELAPSGGDDGPAIVAMAIANSGLVYLSPGRFRVESYTELHIEGLGLTGLHLMGAGEGITFIDVPESFPSSLGTPFANWLDAKPALRIFTTSNNVTAITIGGFTMTRVAPSGARVTTNSGLAVCFDVPPTYPATGYQPYEPLRLRNIRVEGFDCAFAANDVTNLDAIGLITTNCNSTFATGFNCDIWSFKDCKFGTSLQAVGPTNKPNTPFFINGYYGRGKETLNYTISGGVGTVATGAPVMVAGADVYLDATSGPLADGVRRILTAGTGTFTFSAAGIADGSGVISMGAHSAWGAGNQWLLDSCWFMGTDRLYRSPSATIGYPPAELKLLNCYFEQVWILVESENDARIDFDSCYFVGHTLTWAQTYRSAYDNTKQQWAVFNFQNAGGNSPSSRVKFRKCFGVTYLDGWVQNIGADAQESRSPFIEFDDCSLSFLENSRKLKWFHLSILSNLSSSQGAVYLEQQYQAAVNAGVEAQIRGIGLHRYRGLIRLASSDPAVYQVSSDAAAMVPTIPATLNVIPPQANIYRLEGVDKTVTISEPKVRRFNTDATLDSYVTAHLVVNGTSRPRIASLQMPKLSFYITQDATAGRQITWDAAYKFHTAFTQATTTVDADKTTFVEFEWDGKNWRQSSSANTWL